MIAGFDPGHAAHVLDDLGELISAGAIFEARQSGIAVPGAVVSFGEVHPVHVANGLMNLWFEHAGRGERPIELQLLQALLDPPIANLWLDRPYTTLHRARSPHPRRRR